MSFRGRHKVPARRAPIRPPKERFLVLTEGKRTEREYLEAFARRSRGALVEVVVPDEHGMPMTLVRAAKRLRDEAEASADREGDDNLRYDQVWCVCDVDQHPHLKSAVAEALAAGISFAVSSPSFELWLLLHFRENPGMRSGAELVQMLRIFVPGYEKRIDFERYEPGYAAAVGRAQRLDGDAASAGEQLRNPSSGVWRMAEAIRGDAQLPGASPEKPANPSPQRKAGR